VVGAPADFGRIVAPRSAVHHRPALIAGTFAGVLYPRLSRYEYGYAAVRIDGFQRAASEGTLARVTTSDHIYWRPLDTAAPTQKMRAIAAYILNRYTNQELSVSRWKKKPAAIRTWHDGKTQREVRIDFSALVRRMHQHRRVDAINFSLPYLMSPLFDSAADIGVPQTFVGSDGGTLMLRLPMAMGESFPLVPQIDREGLAIADMQALVEGNIVSLFNRLVAKSHEAPQPRSGWLTSFRMLANECVTAIDMMLHKIYLLAEYRGSELGWTFERDAMGPRQGTRVADKLHWISLVSGKAFSLEKEPRQAFFTLKNLRNHLAHFDPPCFAATLEEVCGWLNLVPLIGEALWSIRTHLRQQLNETIVEILLLPRLEFLPKKMFGRDAPPPIAAIGYASASWPPRD
jgi:hypothetical protein